MIVFRASSRAEQPRNALRRLARFARSCSGTQDDARELLIELGTIESGIADALSADCDTVDDITAAFRSAITEAAGVLVAAWDGAASAEIRASLAATATTLERIATRRLPDAVAITTPEGYAYYAHYPEQHLEAARAVVRLHGARKYVCIGIRSIGTSLSAIVTATLDREGADVRTYTVRPRGHPFDRRIALGPKLERELLASRSAIFLITDEGPGLSGSSFASVAFALSELGVPDDRIIFLPSWMPDETALRSSSARERWRRHAKIAVPFENVWLATERLGKSFAANAGQLEDLSAGAWRRRWIADPARWPAVQPQHERRKYLAHGPGGDLLIKFVGLGRRGRVAYKRALTLADAGFTTPPVGLAHGFLATRIVEAEPLRPDFTEPALLDRIADYLQTVTREFTTTERALTAELREMLEVNASEAVGPSVRTTADALAREPSLEDAAATTLDGRMLPHEWLRTPSNTLLKSDATDHYDDHFFPGAHDIAWDVASTIVEFHLDPSAERALVERVASRTGDRTLARRLPFHRAAYAAYRLGYSRLAAEHLTATEEARRWRAEASRYDEILRAALQRDSRAA